MATQLDETAEHAEVGRQVQRVQEVRGQPIDALHEHADEQALNGRMFLAQPLELVEAKRLRDDDFDGTDGGGTAMVFRQHCHLTEDVARTH